jgi:rubrerythrin
MNKSTLEKVTGWKVIKMSRESYGLAETEDSAPTYVEKGKKEGVVFDKLHQAFWKARKEKVFERDNWRCRQCSSVLQLQVDHIVNRSCGGTHDMENLQVLCANCHHYKTMRLSK